MAALTTILALLTGVACEPPPPPPVFTVNSHAGGGDTNPGDGVCETAPANGVCTITAAVEEGNALGKAVIDFPVHTDPNLEVLLAATTITGDITIRSTFDVDNPAVAAFTTGMAVAPGAILRLVGFTLFVQEGLTVEGSMLVDRSGLAATTTVAEGGSMFVWNSLMLDSEPLAPGRSMVTNEGTLMLRFSHISTSQPMLHTAPGATSIMGASYILGPQLGACTGTPVVSEGYNEEPQGDDRCTTDAISWPTRGDEAVPYGELGCGTTITVDNRGQQRPVDDDGDGIARCGVGPLESGWS